MFFDTLDSWVYIISLIEQVQNALAIFRSQSDKVQ